MIREILVKHGALQFSVNPVAMGELKAEILKGKQNMWKLVKTEESNVLVEVEAISAQYITELFEETK